MSLHRDYGQAEKKKKDQELWELHRSAKWTFQKVSLLFKIVPKKVKVVNFGRTPGCLM